MSSELNLQSSALRKVNQRGLGLLVELKELRSRLSSDFAGFEFSDHELHLVDLRGLSLMNGLHFLLFKFHWEGDEVISFSSLSLLIESLSNLLNFRLLLSNLSLLNLEFLGENLIDSMELLELGENVRIILRILRVESLKPSCVDVGSVLDDEGRVNVIRIVENISGRD